MTVYVYYIYVIAYENIVRKIGKIEEKSQYEIFFTVYAYLQRQYMFI